MAEYERLNPHLWQAFALSKSKRAVYPLVRQQLRLLTTALQQPHSAATHQRLCVLAGDLFQLAGEAFFDSNRYTNAAHCYTLAADAGKEAGAYDLWACALTRHAFVGMYERRFADVAAMLDAASAVARRGDQQLSTRYWVAAVQTQAYAGAALLVLQVVEAGVLVAQPGQAATASFGSRVSGFRRTIRSATKLRSR